MKLCLHDVIFAKVSTLCLTTLLLTIMLSFFSTLPCREKWRDFPLLTQNVGPAWSSLLLVCSHFCVTFNRTLHVLIILYSGKICPFALGAGKWMKEGGRGWVKSCGPKSCRQVPPGGHGLNSIRRSLN